jgi:hypothetical protein
MKEKIITYGLITILCVALIAMGVAWYGEKYKPIISKTGYVTPKPMKKVGKIKKKEIPVEKIISYDKEEVVKKVKGLPNYFVENADEQVIASADLPETKTGYEVLGTINTQTGVGNIIAKEKKQSLFGFPNEKEIGIRAGYNTGMRQQVSVYGKWDFLRVGNIYLGAYGEGNSEGNAVGQLEIAYRF